MIEDTNEDNSNTADNLFSIYARQINNVKRSTRTEQAGLRGCAYGGKCLPAAALAAHKQLWAEASKIVLYVLGRMKRNGRIPSVGYDDLDAIQEANITVASALPQWDPIRGTLATWLVPHIRGSLLNYANTHNNAGIGSKHVSVTRVGLDEQVDSEEDSSAQDEPGQEQTIGITREENLTYSTDVIPSPFDAYAKEQLEQAVGRLPMPDYDYAAAHWIDGYSVSEIAAADMVSGETVRRALRRAERSLQARMLVMTGDYFDMQATSAYRVEKLHETVS